MARHIDVQITGEVPTPFAGSKALGPLEDSAIREPEPDDQDDAENEEGGE